MMRGHAKNNEADVLLDESRNEESIYSREAAIALSDNTDFGVIKDVDDLRDYSYATVAAPAAGLPPARDIPNPYGLKNQFSRGSCTNQAFSAHREHDEGVNMSARYGMARTKEYEGNTEYGAYTRNAFIVGQKAGTCLEALDPEPPIDLSWEDYISVRHISQGMDVDASVRKINSYWRLNTVDELRNLIGADGKTAVLSMAWHREFNRPDANGDIPKPPASSFVGGHAVKARGYDDAHKCLDGTVGAVRIQNSWGKWWGKDGEFWLPYSFFKDYVWDIWTSLDIPVVCPVDNRYGQARTWSSYMREQSIAFNPWLKSKIGRLPTNREISALAYGYWGYEDVFTNTSVGTQWLFITKPEARKRGIVKAVGDSGDDYITPSESLTLKAATVALVSSLAIILRNAFGIEMASEMRTAVLDGIFAFIDVAAIFTVIYGRMRATKPVSLFRPREPKE
jgi:hypothetical protein